MSSTGSTEASADRDARAPDATFREWVGPLGGLLLVAALVRAVAWSRTTVMFNDGPIFLAIAESIGAGRWAEVLGHPYHPLYPALIHGTGAFGLDPPNAAVAVSIGGALLGIASMHALLRQAFDLEVAWLGAWILALHPWALDFSSDVMSDGLYLGLFLASFAALSRLVERAEARAACVFALFFVLAFLVRPEAFGLLVIALLLVGVRAVLDPEYRRQAVRPLAILVGMSVLGLSPYLAVLSIEAGELTLTQKKSVTALVQGEARPTDDVREATGLERPAIWLPESSNEPHADRPARDFGGVLESVVRVVRTSAAALRYEVLLFVLVGLIVARRQSTREWRWPVFVLPAIAYSGVLVLLVWGAGYVSRRHALAGLIPLIGFAALAWQALGRGLLDRVGFAEASAAARRRWVCGVLVVVLALVWGPRDLRERRVDRAALRAAAEWIGETKRPGDRVSSEKLRTAYYAGTPFVPLRAVPGHTLESSLRGAGVRFVVVDQERIERIGEDWAHLESALRPVHRARRSGREAIVFELE